MSIAQFVDFKRAGRGGSSRPGDWRGNVQILYPTNFWRDESMKWATDDGKHIFSSP